MKFVRAIVIGAAVLVASQANATMHVITVEDTGFTPASLQIVANDTVTWQIGSGEVSVATLTSGTPGSPDGLWDTLVDFSNPYTRIFTEVGLFDYYDTLSGFTGQISSEISAGIFDDDDDADTRNPYALSQNSPNPFNAATQIQYSLDVASTVQLGVYNILGQRVRTLDDGLQSAGSHTVIWDGRDERGSDASSGIYFMRLVSADGVMIRKMVLLR